jgi:predicted nuclease of restriction endonuclease-like (RecB) superfamily
VQGDFTYQLGSHTLGAGFYIGEYRVIAEDSSLVFPVDANGNQTSDVPTEVKANTSATNVVAGVYLNDLWQITDQWRANVGMRLDTLTGFTHSNQLTEEFGRGRTKAALTRMMQFAERFPDPKIVATLSQQLTWSHVVELLPLKDSLQRDFYAEMCRLENWSVRTLRAKIDGMLFERTGLSRKPAELAEQELRALRDEDRLTPDLVFRDPYVLDFLGLHDSYSERELEAAILREIESFLLELGNGFAFIARQKRIRVDDEDFYIDLLLYHRKLRRLVAVDLKLEKFRPEHAGQMEFYLRWLAKHEQQPHEESPLGLILCSAKSQERIELMELGKSSIRVAEYLTVLPPRDLLAKKLHEAIRQAQARMLPESPPPPQTA